VNAIGIRKEVFADIGLYVKDNDRHKAAKIGVQGLPLKLGDTILLCSDGLIKSDAKGARFVQEDEIVHAIQTETQPNAAALKMTGLAEGRYVDDNVTALTVQYTSPELIENVLRKQERNALRQKLIYAGIGLTAVLIIGGGSLLASKNIGELSDQKANVENQLQTLTNQPTAPPTFTPMIALPAGTLNFVSMGSKVEDRYESYLAGGPDNPKWTVSGSEVWAPIKADGSEEITLGTTGDNSTPAIDIQTFGDVGVMLSLGAKQQMNSSVFIYGSSDTKLTYTDILEMELRRGTVFLKLESRSEIAQITLPNHQNAIAKLTGGSMLLHLNGDEVQLWCLKDDCSLEFVRESERTFAVQRRSYFPVSGVVDLPMDIIPGLYDELWAYNIKCNRCMDAGVVPEPTPTPTSTPVPIMLTGTQERRTDEPTATFTPTDTPTAIPTATFTPTHTPTPTATPVPPTATTPIPPTATTPPPFITEEPPVILYNVTLLVDDNSHGTVSGGGTYAAGKTAKISASPKTNWSFTGWSEGYNGTDNPHSFTVTGDITIIANFVKAEDTGFVEPILTFCFLESLLR